MKNLTAAILIILFVLITFLNIEKDDSHEVLKVLSATEFYIDKNNNKTAEVNELVILNLETEPDELGVIQLTQLNYLGKKFAKSVLLNKKVKIQRKLNEDTKIILPDGKDYEKELIAKGYIFTGTNRSDVNMNLELARKLNLVSYNTRSHKYHKLNCKYALKSRNIETMELKDVPQKAKPCAQCHLKKSKTAKLVKKNKYPKEVYEKYMPAYKDASTEFYITDFTKYYYPSTKCLTTPCKSLLNEINKATSTIDFAIYGTDKQAEITNALINAQKRGVRVRWVYDTDKKGSTIYSETLQLKNILKNSRRDIDINTQESVQYKDAIMHNKFFIFDNQKIWTGSANITFTDLSGFNANTAILINSKEIAKIYTREFESMYSGRFHQHKVPTPNNLNIIGASKIRVYFSPQDKIITNAIIPLLNDAKRYIYIPVFVITHKEFNQALINAKNRGVEIKIIVDATSAGSTYSSVKNLRANKIPVKAENRAGKMHMKSIIIDDKYVITGSMNFTKSGESYNDENVLIIENPAMAKAFKSKFLYFWQTIPDKWLYKNPGAESFNSINSCFDGIDNDFDGKIDMLDDSCNYKVRKTKLNSKN